jgi:hypothetical protein
MTTPKEKAIELRDKMFYQPLAQGDFPISINMARYLALIAVEEILKDTENIYFWHEVKSEIEAL